MLSAQGARPLKVYESGRPKDLIAPRTCYSRSFFHSLRIPPGKLGEIGACHRDRRWYFSRPFMKADIHPDYAAAEIRCACGTVIKTKSVRKEAMIGICNVCHPFYTGQQKFVDTAGRVDKFQQRAAKTAAARAKLQESKKKKKSR